MAIIQLDVLRLLAGYSSNDLVDELNQRKKVESLKYTLNSVFTNEYLRCYYEGKLHMFTYMLEAMGFLLLKESHEAINAVSMKDLKQYKLHCEANVNRTISNEEWCLFYEYLVASQKLQQRDVRNILKEHNDSYNFIRIKIELFVKTIVELIIFMQVFNFQTGLENLYRELEKVLPNLEVLHHVDSYTGSLLNKE